MMKNRILVECDNDESFVFAFGKSKYEVDHNINGRSEVLKNLSNSNNCTGFIDFDKRIDDDYFIKECKFLKEISDDIHVYYDEKNKNHIIVFHKELENVLERIIKNTKSIDTLKKLGLPINYGGLHKQGRIKKNEFKNLCETLIQRSSELQQLKEYL